MPDISAVFLLLGLLLVGHAAGPAAMAEQPTLAQQSQLQSQLRQHPIVLGHFTQQRQLSGLARPIESSGRFVFWRQHGLYWETLRPFYQATTFSANDVIYWDSSEGPALQSGATDPVQKYVSQVMLALFSADMDELDKLFNSQWQSDGNSWSLVLLPAQAAVGRIIGRVQLGGDQYLRQLSVETRSGDTNTMLLDNITAPASLTPSQCLRFSRDGGASCEVDRK